MSIPLRENCLICDGSGRMSLFEITYQGKKTVLVRCTACDGTGEILSVDHTRTELSGNWRSHKKWKTVHYILDDRPLCGLIKSREYISKSIVVEEPDPSSICTICIRKYDILTSS
jgi:RecJ-like exonuclease